MLSLRRRGRGGEEEGEGEEFNIRHERICGNEHADNRTGRIVRTNLHTRHRGDTWKTREAAILRALRLCESLGSTCKNFAHPRNIPSNILLFLARFYSGPGMLAERAWRDYQTHTRSVGMMRCCCIETRELLLQFIRSHWSIFTVNICKVFTMRLYRDASALHSCVAVIYFAIGISSSSV